MKFMNHFPRPNTSKYERGFLGRNPYRSSFYEDDFALPAMNVNDKEKMFEIELIAPGMNKEDFDIQIRQHILHIRVERKFENENASNENSEYSQKEYYYQSFTRSYALPEFINENEVSASYKNGVLKLTFPKKENVATNKVKSISIS